MQILTYNFKKWKLKSFFSKIWSNRPLRLLVLTLPIFLYYLPVLLTGEKISAGDTDYYFATYEAFRKTILEYHQFPWWNPWMAGGLPLFGNIQFGLISIQAPFVLVFGTVLGIKISFITYGIIGFFGVRRLLSRYCKASPIRSIALSYTFIFSSFFASRVYAGHYTFLLASLTPWIIYYFIYRDEKFAWIKLSFFLSLLVLSSPHYVAIFTVLILFIIFLFESIKFTSTANSYKLIISQNKKRLTSIFYALLLTAAAVSYRMFYVYDFYKDYRRIIDPSSEGLTNPLNIFMSMWGYSSLSTSPHGLTYSWSEISAYIGLGTLLALVLIIVSIFWYRKTFLKQFTTPLLALIIIATLFFSLSLGYFGRFSAYAIFQQAPILSSMRVATRWVFWLSCVFLIVIASYRGRKFKNTITLLCVLSAAQLFITFPTQISQAYHVSVCKYNSKDTTFTQVKSNRVPRLDCSNNLPIKNLPIYDENLYESTLNNIGQVYASDSLLTQQQNSATSRCRNNSKGMPCKFVATNNAKVIYWSPNYIKIERTDSGPIELDMNPGRGWQINEKYPFALQKSVSATDIFIFGQNENTKYYEIRYSPKLSPSWIIWKTKQTLS